MQNVHRLRAIRFLTEQQVVTALAFYQDPNRFRLAPTLFGVLHEIIIQGEPLEKIEERRGWPARSAKAILSVLLHSLEETRGTFWCDPDVSESVEEMKATVEYITGESLVDQGEVMQRFGATQKEAKLFLILERAKGSVVSKDQILSRLYDARQIDEVPDLKIVDVFICKLRAKIENRGYEIKTLWGAGYSLHHETDTDIAKRDAEWFDQHKGGTGLSMCEIARKAHVQPSTVMRAIHREDARRRRA